MNRHRAVRSWIGLRGLEWFLLLFGLAALDTYIWVNTSSIVSQAYADWRRPSLLR